VNTVDQRAWKGKAMEGWVAGWYTRTRRHDMEQFRAEATRFVDRLRRGSSVLEVGPGPGFFAIELAKLGDFRITGLDISQTLVEIARKHAVDGGVNVDFRVGNASAMPFEEGSFDFVYCSAAFKNFSEPVKALNEMHRVLRPECEAVIMDLRKDASLDQIDRYVKQSGRSLIDAWMTRWTFRHMLLKRAYARDKFLNVAKQSRFGACEIAASGIELEVRFRKPPAMSMTVPVTQTSEVACQ
jgi:ubiquinone/menaquinone biosynthesis C-methylase UbiE